MISYLKDMEQKLRYFSVNLYEIDTRNASANRIEIFAKEK